MTDLMMFTDGYKMDHRRQYPTGTTRVYSNFTPRTSRSPGQTHVPLVGLQYFLHRYFGEIANRTFFEKSRVRLASQYGDFAEKYLGTQTFNVEHIRDLHNLGYLPLEVRALPEGTLCPLRVPMFTIENTHPDFFWLTNYFETLISSVLWMPCTSAATALRYRDILDAAALKTTGSTAGVEWQAHDFSFRGMACPEAAALSGLGHLAVFNGTDSIPSLQLINDYYEQGCFGGTVPATEHSVMCAGGMDGEAETIERILDLYPSGYISQVMDTWDLWHVLTEILPKLKAKILGREGKLVIRPDSGDPADILCGTDRYAREVFATPRPDQLGVIEILWDVFGGTVNDRGYKVLDSHIGAIYGDSITEERARDITARLEAKGFASTNVVFGVGSYTYQYVTRDTHGFAMKATWAMVDGEERQLYKNPVTDNGTKRSAKGRLAVIKGSTGLELIDGLSLAEHEQIAARDLLEPVWRNGQFLRTQTLTDIRSRLARPELA